MDSYDARCPCCGMYVPNAYDAVQGLKAELVRARRAGRRLGAYWRVQAAGAEGLHDAFVDRWRARMGEALGLDRPLLAEQLAAIRSLRERVEKAESGLQAHKDQWSAWMGRQLDAVTRAEAAADEARRERDELRLRLETIESAFREGASLAEAEAEFEDRQEK